MPPKLGKQEKCGKRRLNRVSAKQAFLNGKYSVLREIFLKANPSCAFTYQSDGSAKCGLTAVDIHHRAGRSGQNLLDTETFFPVCRFHHDWIETHKNQARAMGLITYGVLGSGSPRVNEAQWHNE